MTQILTGTQVLKAVRASGQPMRVRKVGSDRPYGYEVHPVQMGDGTLRGYPTDETVSRAYCPAGRMSNRYEVLA